MIEGLQRVCVKLYAPEPKGMSDQVFVPIFHEWISTRALSDVVLVDVADYAHAPDSPGIMLVGHEVSFAMDRADGRYGLLAQRRAGSGGDTVEAIAATLRQALRAAARLERDPRLVGRLEFETGLVRVEANDRLRAPNTDDGYDAFEPYVRRAVEAVFGGRALRLTRVANDPRDRLAVEVRLEESADLEAFAA